MATSPIRINPSLVAAAEREGMLQKRSTPKQIEYWADLGRAVEHVIELSDVLAVKQGLKRLKLEDIESVIVDLDEVFNDLARRRQNGSLANDVTGSPYYFEASKTDPGLLDRLDLTTGVRQTGQFRDGKFEPKI